MAIKGCGAVFRQVRDLFEGGAVGGRSDGELLERFLDREGAASESAFAALVERHGGMVLRTCRSVLRDAHAAEDAFQATFLVLARRARGLHGRESIGPWLHQVARRTALCARAASSRRDRHERRAAGRAVLEVAERPPDDGDAILNEVDRLPEGYRLAVLLCDLEGLTSDEAARRLGWPVGTVRSRLARGRDRLRDRLTKRGLAPSTMVPALGKPFGAVPTALAGSTARAAMAVSSGVGLGSGTFPAPVAALVSLVSRSLLMTKLQWATAGLLAIGVATLGTAGLARQEADPASAPAPGGATGTSLDPFASASPTNTQKVPDAAGGMMSAYRGNGMMESMMGGAPMMGGAGMGMGMMGGAGMGMGGVMAIPNNPVVWEYTTWRGSALGSPLIDACNQLGAEGWELSGSLAYGDPSYGQSVLIFKRPKGNTAPAEVDSR